MHPQLSKPNPSRQLLICLLLTVTILTSLYMLRTESLISLIFDFRAGCLKVARSSSRRSFTTMEAARQAVLEWTVQRLESYKVFCGNKTRTDYGCKSEVSCPFRAYVSAESRLETCMPVL